jgi:hypothetical protein
MTATSPQSNQTELLPHIGEEFVSQTLFLGGHGYINCTFERCTLIVTNAPIVLHGCTFRGCNFHIEYDLLWGAPHTLAELEKVLELVREAYKAREKQT